MMLAVVCAALAAGALAAQRPGRALAQGSAAGKHARALAVAHDFGTPKQVLMTVKANPPQRVSYGWVSLCGGTGLLGRAGDGGVGRTPLSVSAPLDPQRPCRLAASATLSAKGYVLVQVRRSP